MLSLFDWFWKFSFLFPRNRNPPRSRGRRKMVPLSIYPSKNSKTDHPWFPQRFPYVLLLLLFGNSNHRGRNDHLPCTRRPSHHDGCGVGVSSATVTLLPSCSDCDDPEAQDCPFCLTQKTRSCCPDWKLGGDEVGSQEPMKGSLGPVPRSQNRC